MLPIDIMYKIRSYSHIVTLAQYQKLEEIQDTLLYSIESVNIDIVTGLLWYQTRDGRYSIDKYGEVS